MSPTVTLEAEPDEATVKAIADGLNAYNEAASGMAFRPEPLWLVARDDQGAVVAGLKGRFAWGWLGVEWLWVAGQERGRGLGSSLLSRAEAMARERGCDGVYLDTFSFQAPGFYAKAGYAELGRLDGLPRGGARIYLAKRFSASGLQNSS
ncbi:GNAT family N-acetyltransferase [Elioraea rosea]|uniref:GNAT family N-acetyltransferase n=1 Tax=Elioraea rosea TaxID=2492390 RepID=UPI001182076A|nr:GNAT family N-acetyltransferase [Elioraea rosea]